MLFPTILTEEKKRHIMLHLAQIIAKYMDEVSEEKKDSDDIIHILKECGMSDDAHVEMIQSLTIVTRAKVALEKHLRKHDEKPKTKSKKAEAESDSEKTSTENPFKKRKL